MAISGKQEIARRQSAFCLLGSIALMVWLLWQGGGLANGGTVSVSMVVAGSSPQNFFPRSVSFGGRSCYIQQTR